MRNIGLAIGGLAALIIISMMVSVVYAKIDTKTVVGIWLLDGIKDGTVKDISGNGHDGVVNGDPKVVPGQFGNALQFNGVSDYIDCGNDESLNLKTFTVTLWIYVPKKQYWNHIVSKGSHVGWGSPGSVNWGVMMVKDKPECLYEIYEDKQWTGIHTQDIELKKWHHLTATYDGDKMEFFCDGVSQGSQSGVKIKLDSSRSFRIGANADAGTPSHFFNGNIDEVALFNMVLSQEDIEDIMNNGLEQALNILSVSPTGVLSTTWARIKESKR